MQMQNTAGDDLRSTQKLSVEGLNSSSHAQEQLYTYTK
jgi:hypothetical protein